MNIKKCVLPIVDIIMIFCIISYISLPIIGAGSNLLSISGIITLALLFIFVVKGIYKSESYNFKYYYKLFETLLIAGGLLALISFFVNIQLPMVYILMIDLLCVFIALSMIRIAISIIKKFVKRAKNVLIVGAGQDGKLIAEEIQKRPNLNLKVVGFLDDNMNSIEDEDSSIPILGLTCDSEAVIKDNDVKVVIIAVKSRMDSNILTDLVKGIPLGVKVWRMYRFYEKITHKFLVSKMSVNWLFYDCVRKKALLYAYLKRICDVISSLLILLLTLPLSILAAIIVKLSDFGPVFFFQTRIGKLGKPFKMIKFRTMYQDKVEENFDDDLTEVEVNDHRIMPLCKILRKFHIDEIPQMLNVLRGDMSIVGPRPIREEIYEKNKENEPFWECRNWVRPGWCGWQQIKVNDPTEQERLGYDLYYIKHRNIVWETAIFLGFLAKVILGKARSK